MKTKLLAVIASGPLALVLCVAGACLPQPAKAQVEPAPMPAAVEAVAPAAPGDSAALPPNIYPTSPLAQVIKLMQAGVNDGVVMTYVTNSGSTFNLDSDKIIYLKDIGVPDDLVTAMIQRDQVLQAQMAASAYQPPPQPAPAIETVVAAPAPAEVTVVEPAPVTVEYFYSTLAPYGAWVDVEGYGRCWRPTVVVGNAGWQPYGDHGHWVWTDCGWYWISDYTWGWAPFHYGRWFHHARFGWCWYPDTVWGPSWVTWRYSGDYCGWAPLPPRAVYREGFGFFYNGATVSVGFDFGLGVGAFTFVRTRDFCDPRPWRHRVEPREVTQIFNRTTVINNFGVDRRNRNFINHGIDPEHITEVTHAPIRPIAIHDAPAPDQRGERLGRDGRTLFVNRPHFNDNPPPAGARGNPPRPASAAQPGFGSPYRPQDNRGNDNAAPQRRIAPTTPTPGQPQPPRPTVGSPSQPPNNNDRNDRSQPPAPRAGTFGSPDRSGPTPPGARPSPTVPVQPSTPNYNSTDNRRYPSPHLQQIEPPNPRMNPGSPGGRVGAPATPPAQPPAPSQPVQRNYGAPATPPSPPARPPAANRYTPPAQPSAPTQPQQGNFVSPRNQTPPSESRPNYSQPPAPGNQTRAPSAPSSPPAQSQQTPQTQRSGRDRNQNGQ